MRGFWGWDVMGCPDLIEMAHEPRVHLFRGYLQGDPLPDCSHSGVVVREVPAAEFAHASVRGAQLRTQLTSLGPLSSYCRTLGLQDLVVFELH